MKQPTNEEWIEQFAAYLKRRYPGRSTATHYVSDMRSFLRHYGGALLEVTRADMDSFVDGQRAASMAPATVKRRAATLKSFFDFLAEEGVWTGKNPVVMKRHAGRQPQKLPRDLKDEEVARLLAVVSQPRDLALVSLLLYGGLRVEEVVNLTERAFYVPRDEAGPVQVRVLGKGRKEWLVYLVRPAYAAVETYVGQQPVCVPDEPLFRSQRGQPLTIAGVQWLLRGYAAQSGVAVTAHPLRHHHKPGRPAVRRTYPQLKRPQPYTKLSKSNSFYKSFPEYD